MDFYWHYVSKDTIDQAGKDSFIRAISIASQVFNSISEYIQVIPQLIPKFTHFYIQNFFCDYYYCFEFSYVELNYV